MERLFLVDGSSYFYRAFFGLSRLSTSAGFPTNAIFVFANMLTRIRRQFRPEYLGMVFDAPGPTFRDEIYARYKATRQPMPEDLSRQIPTIKLLPGMFAIPVIEWEGVEADDVIGTLAGRGVAAGLDVVILTGDKDLMQLVSKRKEESNPGIVLYDDMKGKWVGIDEVVEKFGVAPERVVDVLALMGDVSDNIPGVRGIGEKTASRLIASHGSLEEVYRHLDRVEPRWRKLLEQEREAAELSRRLATVRRDVPLSVRVADLRPGEIDREALIALFTELEFTSLPKQLDAVPAPSGRAFAHEGYRIILEARDLARVADEMRGAPRISLDLETTSPDPMRARIVGLCLAASEGQSRYIPIAHAYLGAPRMLSWKDVLESLRPILQDPERPVIGQNIKYDALVLARHGVDVGRIGFDTMVAAYLLNPDRGPHNLETLCREVLGMDKMLYADVAGRDGFDQVPVERARDYSGEDVDAVLRLTPLLERRLREAGMLPLLQDLELPLIRVLLDMERAGVRIETSILARLSAEFSARMRAVMAEIHAAAGEEFNIDSPKQLQRILFDKLGLKRGRQTKTGFSTDIGVLEKLAAVHALPAKILEYRQLAKLKSTYVEALPHLVHPETGRVHTSYNQAIAATGRLSSSDPNLQNIPIRTAEGKLIRTAFVPDSGHLYVAADYSQIELRVLAHLSEDPRLAAAFREDRDIHQATAAEVFDVPPDRVTEDQRRKAKAINFGILYGMSAMGLAQRLGIDHRTAQEYIDRYFHRYGRVRSYLDQTLHEARERGYVATLLGRRRYVPGLTSKNRAIRAPAERVAVNAPIQGTAADLMKMAMIAVHRRLKAERRKARIILQVHDELVLEALEREATIVAELLREEMEGVYRLKVPLKVHLARGGTWAELD